MLELVIMDIIIEIPISLLSGSCREPFCPQNIGYVGQEAGLTVETSHKLVIL